MEGKDREFFKRFTMLCSETRRTYGCKPPAKDRNCSVHVDKVYFQSEKHVWKAVFRALLTTSIIDLDVFLHSSHNARDIAGNTPYSYASSKGVEHHINQPYHDTTDGSHAST